MCAMFESCRAKSCIYTFLEIKLKVKKKKLKYILLPFWRKLKDNISLVT